jgi:hypothetical protein
MQRLRPTDPHGPVALEGPHIKGAGFIFLLRQFGGT